MMYYHSTIKIPINSTTTKIIMLMLNILSREEISRLRNLICKALGPD